MIYKKSSNMKNILFYFQLGIAILFSVYSCTKDEDIIKDGNTIDENIEDADNISSETIAVNQWIYETMEGYYYWNDKLPTTIDYTTESDPEEYFYKLLYDEDKWSWITDDYASLVAEFSGEPLAMGYDPTFYLLSDGSTVIMVVNYVYPNSPADEAGLERGDIILSIDNTELDTTNYYDLYSGTNYSVQLGILESNSLSYSGESIDLIAEVISTDPSIYYDVIDTNGYKIGYLVYVEFISGDNSELLTELDDIFTTFISEGMTDLIVDLRYNPGGEIDAARYLASLIAPSNAVNSGEILVNLNYNDELQAYLEYYEEEYADYLSYSFISGVSNTNMQKVYFLTTYNTASASELVISGLDPYMDVIQIGESTYGKYTGAWVIPDDDEEWAMIPIVMKYSNVLGYTDFVDGLTPDYSIEDDLISAVPFGDLSDPMLAKAVSLITGQSLSVAQVNEKSASSYTRILPKERKLKNNLYLPFKYKQQEK